MECLHVAGRGLVNSFRLPDYHTYHKTLPLPPKTTIAGFIGAALGISPEEVNDEWLVPPRFYVAIRGQANVAFKDLWQYRKYTGKGIKEFTDGKAETPWFTSVTTRELLYGLELGLYFFFKNEADIALVEAALNQPAWAPSLGREDELLLIDQVRRVIVQSSSDEAVWSNTVLPFDIHKKATTLAPKAIENIGGNNLLAFVPTVVKLPTSFTYSAGTRIPNQYQEFTFVGNLPIKSAQGIEHFILQEGDKAIPLCPC